MNKDFSGHYGRDDRKPALSERRNDGENGSDRPEGQNRPERHFNAGNFGNAGGANSERRRETSDRPNNFNNRSDRPDRTNDSGRGGFGDRPSRPSFNDRGDRPDRGGFGDRPARPSFSDRNGDSGRGGFGDRPARPSFNDRGDRPDRGGFGDRSARPSFGDRPDRGDRPARPSYRDRPDRGDRADSPSRPRYENRGERPDRPKFEDDRAGRPSFNDRGDRPARGSRPDGGYGPAPQRRFDAERRPNDPDFLVRGEARKSYGKSSEELERSPSHRSFDAWKQGEGGGRGERPAQGGSGGPRNFSGDRPPRRDFDDRGPRRDFGDRPPRRDFDDRGPRRDFGDRPPRRDFEARPPRSESFTPKPATETRENTSTSEAGDVRFDKDPLSFLGQDDDFDGDDSQARPSTSTTEVNSANPNAPRDWRDYSSERRSEPRGDYRDSRPSRDDSRGERPRFDSFQRDNRDNRSSYGDRPDRGSYGDRDNRDSRPDRPAFSRTRERTPDRNPHGPGQGNNAGKDRLAQADIRELPEEIRLNRFLSLAGVASRRKADELIEAGAIKVNGEVVSELGRRVHAKNDVVEYNNYRLFPEPPVYILLNKPKDYITTTDDPEERKTVMSLLDEATRERIYPVGRLDRNTTGLLLLTNDGELAMKLTHPSHEIAKLYEVHLDKPLRQADLDNLAEGVVLEDGLAQVDEIAYADPIDKRIIGVSLHIGRNRIVRRLFEHFGYTVEKLDRTIYAGLTKKDLTRGHWRYLNDSEVRALKRL